MSEHKNNRHPSPSIGELLLNWDAVVIFMLFVMMAVVFFPVLTQTFDTALIGSTLLAGIVGVLLGVLTGLIATMAIRYLKIAAQVE